MLTVLSWFAGVAVLTKDQVARAGANVVLKVVVVRAFVAATLRVAVVNRALKNIFSSASKLRVKTVIRIKANCNLCAVLLEALNDPVAMTNLWKRIPLLKWKL